MRPDTASPSSGDLVVHVGAWLDAHAEGRAERLAEQGYVVFAYDMCGEGVAGDRQRVMSWIVAGIDVLVRWAVASPRRMTASLTIAERPPPVGARWWPYLHAARGDRVVRLA